MQYVCFSIAMAILYMQNEVVEAVHVAVAVGADVVVVVEAATVSCG